MQFCSDWLHWMSNVWFKWKIKFRGGWIVYKIFVNKIPPFLSYRVEMKNFIFLMKDMQNDVIWNALLFKTILATSRNMNV